MRDYKKYVTPQIPFLKTGVVWGDGRGQNIVLEELSDTKVDRQEHSFPYSIAGVIDFGDCNHTCYVFELAIMLENAMQGRKDPMQFVCPMITGYLHAFPLGKEDIDCLYYAVLARLCQAVTVTEYQYSQEPWNSYLGGLTEPAWELIDELVGTPKEEVDRVWSYALNKTPNDYAAV